MLPKDESVLTDSNLSGANRGVVVVLNRDLMFGIQIRNVLRAAGFEVTSTPSTRQFVDHLRHPASPIALGIVNMVAEVDWALIGGVMNDPTTTPVLAFGPHVHVPLWRSAKSAGVTRVVSNGDFHRDMLSLVERYARRAPVPHGTPDD